MENKKHISTENIIFLIVNLQKTKWLYVQQKINQIAKEQRAKQE